MTIKQSLEQWWELFRRRLAETVWPALPLQMGILWMMGRLLFGPGVLEQGSQISWFGFLGFTAAVTIVLVRARGLLLVPLLLLAMIALDTARLDSLTLALFTARVVYLLAGALAGWLYAARYHHRVGAAPLERALVLAGLMALSFIIAAVGLGLGFPVYSFDAEIFWQTSQGFFIGLGLGAGLELSEYIVRRG